MDDDRDNILKNLADVIVKAFRKFTVGAEKQANDLQLPGPVESSDPSTGGPTQPQPLELPTQTIPPSELAEATKTTTFTTLDPPEPIPAKAPELPHPDVVKPKPFFESAPATAVSALEIPPSPHPDPPPAPPLAQPVPPVQLPEPSQVNMRRGFSADDPGGAEVLRHEQMAQAQRYDKTNDMLFEAMVEQSRIDRDYRQREYGLLNRMVKDANSDYRRIDELERGLECTRESITDVNI